MIDFKDLTISNNSDKSSYLEQAILDYVKYQFPELNAVKHDSHFGLRKHITITKIGGWKIRGVAKIVFKYSPEDEMFSVDYGSFGSVPNADIVINTYDFNDRVISDLPSLLKFLSGVIVKIAEKGRVENV